MIMLSIFSACFAGQCGRGEGSETKAARPTNTAHFHVRMSLRKILRTAAYECDHAPTGFFSLENCIVYTTTQTASRNAFA